MKKFPAKNSFEEKAINLKVSKTIDRDDLIEKLKNIGYKRESLVTNTGEFSVRGFVIDVFPIFSDRPVRIQFFDEEIDEIKYFNENTQLSIQNTQEVVIKPVNDEYNGSNSSILSYLYIKIIIK